MPHPSSPVAGPDGDLPRLRRQLEVRERELGRDAADTLTAASELEACLKGLRRFEEALPLARRLHEASMALHGEESQHTAKTFAQGYRYLYEFSERERTKFSTYVERSTVRGVRSIMQAHLPMQTPCSHAGPSAHANPMQPCKPICPCKPHEAMQAHLPMQTPCSHAGPSVHANSMQPCRGTSPCKPHAAMWVHLSMQTP